MMPTNPSRPPPARDWRPGPDGSYVLAAPGFDAQDGNVYYRWLPGMPPAGVAPRLEKWTDRRGEWAPVGATPGTPSWPAVRSVLSLLWWNDPVLDEVEWEGREHTDTTTVLALETDEGRYLLVQVPRETYQRCRAGGGVDLRSLFCSGRRYWRVVEHSDRPPTVTETPRAVILTSDDLPESGVVFTPDGRLTESDPPSKQGSQGD